MIIRSPTLKEGLTAPAAFDKHEGFYPKQFHNPNGKYYFLCRITLVKMKPTCHYHHRFIA